MFHRVVVTSRYTRASAPIFALLHSEVSTSLPSLTLARLQWMGKRSRHTERHDFEDVSHDHEELVELGAQHETQRVYEVNPN